MKKSLIILLLIAVILSIFTISATAVEERTSEYFNTCTASAAAGSTSGDLKVTYRVTTSASGITRIGVLSIIVYDSNGGFYKRIFGTTENGLIKQSGSYAAGRYTIQCKPSSSYYCVVTFVSQNANGYDTRSITTNTITTPG